jgi:hypothetical protein
MEERATWPILRHEGSGWRRVVTRNTRRMLRVLEVRLRAPFDC